MATYYSPLSFFKGGKRNKTRKSKGKSKKSVLASGAGKAYPKSSAFRVKGGFYPSIMTGVVQNGAYLVPVALRQGYKLLNNNNKKTRKVRKNRK